MHIDADIKDKVIRFLDEAPGNMVETLGIEFTSFKKDEVKARMPVDKRTIQPFGILHGGASVTLAETLASIGAWLNIDEKTKAAVGIEINANHLRSVPKEEEVVGRATPVHLGGQIHVWNIEIHNTSGKLICTSRCTLAIIENSK